MELTVKNLTTEAERDLAQSFGAVKSALPGDARIARLRSDAFADYAARGLPHRRVEEWKYTDLRARMKEALRPGEAAPGEVADLRRLLGAEAAALDAWRLVTVNGVFRPDLSDLDELRAEGVEALGLAEALAAPPSWVSEHLAQVNAPEGDAVVSLNAAFMAGGVALRIPAGSKLDKPIHIVEALTGAPASSFTRNLVVAGDDAHATLIESAASDAGAFQRNSATELVAGDGAEIAHIKLQLDAAEALHLSTWMVRLGARARYRAFQFTTGSGFARHQLYLRYAGEHALAEFNGAALLGGTQHVDTTLVIDHAVPHCTSRELFKAVLDGGARAIFQGKVIVRPHAQKTDGKQMAQALLLSDDAEFDSKPELEIFADDVVCGHGSTAGQIDEDLLFYLRARGLPEPVARGLLIQAFVGEAIETVENEAVRDMLNATVAAHLDIEARG
jgi:FeS assembly protein SufD